LDFLGGGTANEGRKKHSELSAEGVIIYANRSEGELIIYRMILVATLCNAKAIRNRWATSAVLGISRFILMPVCHY